MKFELKTYNRNISDQDLLDDLRKVANEFGKGTLTQDEYNAHGKYNGATMARRFGTWNKAIEKAGLEIFLQRNISEVELFENIEEVWVRLGRQPGGRDLKAPLSKYSERPYLSKFGTWQKALQAFVEYINTEEDQNQQIELPKKNEENSEIIYEIGIKHKTKRHPSERLKVQVLMRDGNRCRLCGLTVTGDNIHFDHITPWSKGGETVLENLQVLCEKHNLAKGNLEYKENENV